MDKIFTGLFNSVDERTIIFMVQLILVFPSATGVSLFPHVDKVCTFVTKGTRE